MSSEAKNKLSSTNAAPGEASKSETLICLYCPDPLKKSREHVFSDTLGANRTIPWVCQRCNNGISDLDRALARESLLTLPRLLRQPDAVLGYSSFITAEDFPGGYVEVEFGYPFKVKQKTQLAFVPQPNESFCIYGTADNSQEFHRFFKLLRKVLVKGRIHELQILSLPAFKFSPRMAGARLVMNRPDEIIFRASNPAVNARDEHQAICRLFEKKIDEVESIFLEGAKVAQIGMINQPCVMTAIKMDFGRSLRGVAKIALNFVAQEYGPDVARSTALGGLRQYIRYGYGSDEAGSLWDIGSGPEDSLTATRYVAWVPDYCQNAVALNLKNAHSILLTQFAGRLIAILEFYQEFAFYVDLGEVKLPGDLPVIHEYNYQDRTDCVRDPVEIARIAMKKSFAASRNAKIDK
jgi:hypothetical protein